MTLQQVQPGQIYEFRDDGRWNIFLDATMSRIFGACPQMFYYQFIKNITPKGEMPFAMNLGSWWSRVMESIYGAQFKGTPLNNAQLIALPLKVWDDLKLDELEKYHPKMYKEFGGKYGALQMMADYVTRQLPIDYRTWKIIAAEASFGRDREVQIGETDKVVLYWLGQPDLYVISDGRIIPVDHKSTGWIDANISEKYKPDVQIPGYIAAGKILAKSLGVDLPIDRAIINCVARTDRTSKDDKDKYPRFRRLNIQYTESELDEWRDRQLYRAEKLRYALENNLWDWNETACNNFYMRKCSFKNIDNKPPSVRPTVIYADYLTRPAWIPGKTEKEMEKGSSE